MRVVGRGDVKGWDGQGQVVRGCEACVCHSSPPAATTVAQLMQQTNKQGKPDSLAHTCKLETIAVHVQVSDTHTCLMVGSLFSNLAAETLMDSSQLFLMVRWLKFVRIRSVLSTKSLDKCFRKLLLVHIYIYCNVAPISL